MTSCSDDIPIYFYAGGTCGGHGICVNSSISNHMLCKCDFGYSGASDFFDSRVEITSEGDYLSFSCTNSIIGIYIAWTIWLAYVLIRIIILTPIWYNFYTRHYREPELIAKGLFFDIPFRIVTIDLFGISISSFIVGICKIGGMTLGTDILPTISYCIMVLIYHIVSFDIAKLEFDIFVQAQDGSNYIAANKAKNLRIFLKLTGIIFSSLAVLVVCICTIFMNKSKGPLYSGGNGEEITLYIYNLSAPIFGLFEVISTWMIIQKAKSLRLIANEHNSVVTYIINKMKKEMRLYLLQIAPLTILYSCLCIPYILPYQTYAIGIIVGSGISLPQSKAFATQRETERESKIKTLSNGDNKPKRENSNLPAVARNSYQDDSNKRKITLVDIENPSTI